MSKSLSKTMSQRAEYWGVRAVLWLCSVIPIGALRRAGAGLGWLAFRVFGFRRAVAIDNIRHAFPDFDEKRVEEVGLRSYMNLGRTAMELAAFSQLSREDVLGMVSLEGEQHFQAARAGGRGAICVTGHFGNWELLGAVAAHRGFAIHGADTNHSNKQVHQLLINLRRCQGVSLLSADTRATRYREVLENNEFVAYIADQDARHHGVFVDFMGRPASTVRGPAIFALRQKCPLVACFIVRDGTDRHRVVIEGAMHANPSLRGEDAVRDLTQQFTRRLEFFVRAYPEQYFWGHRRWKTRPPS